VAGGDVWFTALFGFSVSFKHRQILSKLTEVAWHAQTSSRFVLSNVSTTILKTISELVIITKSAI
jgi:hypothetical protein